MPAKDSKKAKQTPKKAQKTSKGGAVGSIKKMLGLGKKSAAPAKAKTTAPAPSKKAAEKITKSAVVSKKTKAPAPAPVVAKPEPIAKKPKGAGAPALKGQTSTQAALRSSPLLKGRSGISSGAAFHPSGGNVCREVACELMSTTGPYCRMHYIKNWKKIKRKQMILKEKKLNSYIEELVSKYPDKYIEAIRQDLASEKDFAKVIADLEIEEGLDDFESVETESAEGIIDNLKRDFEDEGDVF